MLDTVREILAREQLDRSAVGVVFTTDAWDNGFFLSATGTVVFADGSTDEVEFDDLDHVFTDAIGVRGPEFGLSVNIRTGEVDIDDYADNLYPRLRPPPPHRARDGGPPRRSAGDAAGTDGGLAHHLGR